MRKKKNDYTKYILHTSIYLLLILCVFFFFCFCFLLRTLYLLFFFFLLFYLFIVFFLLFLFLIYLFSWTGYRSAGAPWSCARRRNWRSPRRFGDPGGTYVSIERERENKGKLAPEQCTIYFVNTALISIECAIHCTSLNVAFV